MINHISNGSRPLTSISSLGSGTIVFHVLPVLSHIQQTLYTTIVRQSLLSKLSDKLEINLAFVRDSIHWLSFRRARKSAPLGLRIFISK